MISGNPFNRLNIVSDLITELNAVVISVDYVLPLSTRTLPWLKIAMRL
jgi:hypothetical protein